MHKYRHISFLVFVILLGCTKKSAPIKSSITNESSSTVNTPKAGSHNSLLPEELYGIWTIDPQGPHADFEITPESFNVVDSDGDGDRNYKLEGSKLIVEHPDFTSTGVVSKIGRDTLLINWDSTETIRYYRWKG